MARRGTRSSLLERLSESAFRDLMTDKRPSSGPRIPPVILLERCPVCREWMPEHSKRDGQCRACDAWLTPLLK
ncbi:MAG: hypothetical protein WC700_02070 [Gemmatimonadaceae bacterium]|jgi:hypothetical protein